MKNQLRHNNLIRLLLIALFLAALPPNVLRADPLGSIAVQLDEELRKEVPTAPAVELAFYQIGEIDADGGNDWKMKTGFEDYGVLEAATTSEMVKIAGQLSKDISGKGVEAQPVTLTGDGAVLSDLALGIYLGVLTKGPEGLTVDPFILTIPSMEEEDALLFDYTVTLKAVYKPPAVPTPTTKPTPAPTKKPTATPKPVITPIPTRNRSTASPVRSGDDNQIFFWAVLMATALAGILAMLLYRRRSRPYRAGNGGKHSKIDDS